MPKFQETDMKNGSIKPRSGRRNFLLMVGAGSAATAAAVVGKGLGTAVPATGIRQKEGKGYQLSEHVRTYYRTAKI